MKDEIYVGAEFKKEVSIQEKQAFLFSQGIGAEVFEDMLTRFGLFARLDPQSPEFLYQVACHNLAIDLLVNASVFKDRRNIIQAMLGRGSKPL